MPNIEQLKKVKDIIDKHTNPQEYMMRQMEQNMSQPKITPEKQEKKSPGISLHLQNAITLKGDRGDVGQSGKDGKTPQRGVDYFTPQDIEVFAKHILEAATPRPGVHYKTGTDGKNGRNGIDADEEVIFQRLLAKIPKVKDGRDGRDGKNADMNVIVEKVLNRLKKEKKQEVSGLSAKDVIEEIRKTKALDISEIRNANPYMGKKLPKLDMSDQRWHGGGLTGSNFVDNEIVAGSGTTFTLSTTPATGSLRLYAGRNRLYPTTDYTLSGGTITTVLTWVAGDLIADFRTG